MKRIFVGLGIIVALFVGFIVFSDYCVACGCVICKADFTTPVVSSSVVNQDVVSVVSASDFNDLLSDNVVLIDIRTPQEFDERHISGAVNIDFYSSSFRNELNSLDKDKVYLIYCRTGSRTNTASEIMKNLGFEKVYVLRGGITDWSRSGFPIVSWKILRFWF